MRPRQVAPEGGSAKLPWTPAAALSGSPADVSCREYKLPAPLAAGGKTTLLSVAVYTHVLRPEPAEVSQRDVQRVVFRGGARLMSPYKVESQATEVRQYHQLPPRQQLRSAILPPSIQETAGSWQAALLAGRLAGLHQSSMSRSALPKGPPSTHTHRHTQAPRRPAFPPCRSIWGECPRPLPSPMFSR